ncbi:MAG: LamG-like jellyroll fold domain-containing protein [Phycisphaeraceae bacterium]
MKKLTPSRCLAVALLLGVTCGEASALSYSEQILAQGPLEYYRLGSATGENGDAVVLNGVTVNNTTPAPTLNETGGFFGLNGNVWGNFSGDGTSALTDVVTGWGSNAGTISLFVRQATTGGNPTRTLFFGNDTTVAGANGSFDSGTNQEIATFVRTNGSYGIFIDNAGLDTIATPMSLNEWHHLAFTWERGAQPATGTLMAYLDGALVASASGLTWDSYTIDVARFGKEISTGSRNFAGSADELAIFNRALSSQEIAAQFAAAFIPEPASATALLLAGTMMFRRARRRA